jgi:hypothetical protein
VSDNGRCAGKGIGPRDTRAFELGVVGKLPSFIPMRDYTGEEFERTTTE